MIQIKHKTECCGCSACSQKCPKKCIQMLEDTEGFLYPQIDISQCVNCHLCERCCPVINTYKSKQPLSCFAAINPNNEIRFKSSSGGIFTALATEILKQGGVVFGAKWDDKHHVIHDYIENSTDIHRLRGSKYIQSTIGDCFIKVKNFLKQKRLVLFVGTPCQISGLNHYLGAVYDNLILVDFICHGVPSHKTFDSYLESFTHKKSISKSDIREILFRDKTHGWKNFSLAIKIKSGEKIVQEKAKNSFLIGFFNNYFLRPSCHNCPTKKLSSGADITLGDFWGYNSTNLINDDDIGVSAVIVNSEKGRSIIDNLNIIQQSVSLAEISSKNEALNYSATAPYRNLYYNNEHKNFEDTIKFLTSKKLYNRIKRKIYLYSNRLKKSILK